MDDENYVTTILREIEFDYDGDTAAWCKDQSTEDVDKVIDIIKDPYAFQLSGTHKFTNLSYTNCREDYYKKFITTSQIAYSFRRLEEWHVPLECEPVPIEDYVIDPSIIDPTENDLKDNLKMSRIEEQKKWMDIKMHIQDFLMDIYQFNPNKHVRTGHWPNNADPERNPINTREAKAALRSGNSVRTKSGKFKGTKHSKHARNILTKKLPAFPEEKSAEPPNPLEEMKEIEPTKEYNPNTFQKQIESTAQTNSTSVIIEDVTVESESESDSESSEDDSGYPRGSPGDIVRRIIPPADYFHMFNMFIENHYAVLHEATTDLYAEKHDLDIGFAVWDVHKDKDNANLFRNKHKDDTPFVIHTIQNNKWTFVGPWQENRDRMEYFNSNTEILSSMLDKKKEDNKLLGDLVHNRVRVSKNKNVEETGPMSESALQYFAANPSEAAKMGAVNINDDRYAGNDDDKNKPISKSKKKRIRQKKKTSNIPVVPEKEALEIVTHVFKKGGKDYKRGKMHTRVIKPDKDNKPKASKSGEPKT